MHACNRTEFSTIVVRAQVFCGNCLPFTCVRVARVHKAFREANRMQVGTPIRSHSSAKLQVFVLIRVFIDELGTMHAGSPGDTQTCIFGFVCNRRLLFTLWARSHAGIQLNNFKAQITSSYEAVCWELDRQKKH